MFFVGGIMLRGKLLKYMQYGQLLDIMYLSKSGVVTKRRVKVLMLHGELFQAYCFTRRAKRTFLVDNVLACIPVTERRENII